jgi:hypothetical protein
MRLCWRSHLPVCFNWSLCLALDIRQRSLKNQVYDTCLRVFTQHAFRLHTGWQGIISSVQYNVKHVYSCLKINTLLLAITTTRYSTPKLLLSIIIDYYRLRSINVYHYRHAPLNIKFVSIHHYRLLSMYVNVYRYHQVLLHTESVTINYYRLVEINVNYCPISSPRATPRPLSSVLSLYSEQTKS